MKKLFVVLGAMSFVFASCSNPQETAVQEETQAKHECQQNKNQHSNCNEMSAEQKSCCETWKDWENLTSEKKVELIAVQKQKINEKIANCEAREAEVKAKKEEFKTKWSKFDQLDIEAQKALINEYGSWHKKPCHKSKTDSCNK